MPATLYPETQWRGTTSDSVLGGGSVSTYVAGTSTPLSTYVDSSAAISAGTSLMLDAYGRANNGNGIWLGENLSYKFVVKDAAGTIIHTIDNISIGALATDKSYVVLSSSGALSAERVLTAGDCVSLVDNGAGSTADLSVSSSSGVFPCTTMVLSGAVSAGSTFTVTNLLTTSRASVNVAADTNNWAPAAAHALEVTVSGANRTITGMVAPATGGTTVMIMNVGDFAYTLDFAGESASSTAANRFAFSGTITLSVSDVVIWVYDSTASRWRYFR